MYYLFRLQAIVVVLLFMLPNQVAAQHDSKSSNYYQFANKKYYFGMSLGYNQSKYKIINSNSLFLSDSLRVVESNTTTGFQVGIITNFKLGDHIDFRVVPTFVFGDRNLTYTSDSGLESPQVFETIFTEIPIIVRYKSRVYRDKKAYVLAGIKYGFDIANSARARNANAVVGLSDSNFAIEYGAGLQFFQSFFIFSPEIKVSHTLGNNLIFENDNEFSNIIDRLILRNITISLNFEG